MKKGLLKDFKLQGFLIELACEVEKKNPTNIFTSSCRVEFHPEGEDAVPGNNEWPEDTGNGGSRLLLSLSADLHADGCWHPGRRAGVLDGYQTSAHQAALQPAASV